MIATRCASVFTGKSSDGGPVAQDNLLRLYLRATSQFRVVLDDARYGFEDSTLGLFQVVGDNENFVRCLLSEGPPEGNRSI